jgi:hypothetical protein
MATAAGQFYPNEAWKLRFGIPDGKSIGYCVCDRHFGEEFIERIEDKLERDLTADAQQN